MAKLIYVTNVSLDGYIEDERGAFDWFPIDDEVFAFTTDLLRSVGTFSTGGACTRRWPSGRPTPLWPRSPTSWPTSRAPGRRRTKSCTPRPSPRCQLPTPDSN